MVNLKVTTMSEMPIQDISISNYTISLKLSPQKDGSSEFTREIKEPIEKPSNLSKLEIIRDICHKKGYLKKLPAIIDMERKSEIDLKYIK